LLEQWRARLVKQLASRPEGFSDGTNLITGRPYPALQARLKGKAPNAKAAPPRGAE
jgi:hypothetical protein